MHCLICSHFMKLQNRSPLRDILTFYNNTIWSDNGNKMLENIQPDFLQGLAGTAILFHSLARMFGWASYPVHPLCRVRFCTRTCSLKDLTLVDNHHGVSRFCRVFPSWFASWSVVTPNTTSYHPVTLPQHYHQRPHAGVNMFVPVNDPVT